MNNLTLIIIAIVGIGFGYWLANKRKCKDVEMTDKQKNKQKILEFLRENEKIANDDVEKMCRGSDATATNYLDALEKEGKIRQVGTTGHAVYYVLK